MTKTDAQGAASVLAVQIGIAVTRLRSRLRREQASVTGGLTMAQLSVLGRLDANGPVTASVLAQAEHVRPQSIAESVAALRRLGLVDGRPDPSDGRKTLLAVTPEGRRLIESIVDLRDAWLARVIDEHLTAEERETLGRAADILGRLADVEATPAPGATWRV